MHVDALILWTAQPKRTIAFYRALGLPLEEERHDDGPLHWACELGSVHFAVYEAGGAGAAPGRREPGASQLGFQVDDALEVIVARAVTAGGVVQQPPEDVPWGRRAVLADPDGRPVEINRT